MNSPELLIDLVRQIHWKSDGKYGEIAQLISEKSECPFSKSETEQIIREHAESIIEFIDNPKEYPEALLRQANDNYLSPPLRGKFIIPQGLELRKGLKHGFHKFGNLMRAQLDTPTFNFPSVMVYFPVKTKAIYPWKQAISHARFLLSNINIIGQSQRYIPCANAHHFEAVYHSNPNGPEPHWNFAAVIMTDMNNFEHKIFLQDRFNIYGNEEDFLDSPGKKAFDELIVSYY
ncbi:MAG: hypothetical protein MUP70_16185 [Candidatus Aminicenantes bacterium]|nr:hypothetical protein [Candidatus Aminicenantes bacterium]